VARKNIDRGIKLYQEIGNVEGLAQLYATLGQNYQISNKLDSALFYHKKGLQIDINLNYPIGISNSYNSIAEIYQKMGNYELAINYFNKSLEIKQQLDDKRGISSCFVRLGKVYFKLGNLQKAKEYCNAASIISGKLNYIPITLHCYELFYKIYKSQNKFEKALIELEKYIIFRDSLNNESTRKSSIKSQLKYEYEKQAAADSVEHAKASEIKNVELEKQRVEIKAKQNQQYALFGGLGLVIIFAGFMFNRFKVTQKQKSIIEHQKEIVEEQKKLVEEKQKEVLDSITYARRIQMAQIPSEKLVINLINKIKNK
jgi:tetratricopeptide (TPR) repeat protein